MAIRPVIDGVLITDATRIKFNNPVPRLSKYAKNSTLKLIFFGLYLIFKIGRFDFIERLSLAYVALVR